MKEIHTLKKFDPYPEYEFEYYATKEIEGKLFRMRKYLWFTPKFIQKIDARYLESQGYEIYLEYETQNYNLGFNFTFLTVWAHWPEDKK